MRIGIFGGAFNPPHIGHVQAAKTAVLQNEIELLLVIPTGTPPHKELPPGTPNPEARLAMTKNAFNSSNKIKVSDIEIFSNERNYTIDTISKIKHKYPGSEILLLVGTDMFDMLSTWKDSENLLRTVTPVLLPRDVIKISSSDIRKMLPLREGNEFLTDTNYSYIIKHRIYNAKPNWDWLREKAHSMLSPLRIPHVEACEAEAIRLAEHWGVNSDDAREAAILHDITKKLDFSQNMCIIAKHGVSVGELGNHGEKLLHSITGALLAQSEFGVSNAVADAIKWHTTGRAKMSMLEKVIYIADYIESTRDFPGVDDLRKAAYENIDNAMIIGLEMTVEDLKARGIDPDCTTYEAISDLRDSSQTGNP